MSDIDKLTRDALVAKFHSLKGTKAPEKHKELSGKGQAVGYIRVSTTKQVEEGYSLEVQTNRIKSYCLLHDLELVQIYDDPGWSGALRDRPSLCKMLNEILPEMKVVAVAVDRIARDTESLLEIKRIIHEKSCSLYLIEQNLDTADPNSEFIFTMLGAMAKQEHTMIKSRISAVMQDMKVKGTLRCKPKFGWKIEEGKMVEVPEEQIVIAYIKQLIEENPDIKVAHICKILTNEGISIRNSKKIYHATIKNIIKNNNLRDKESQPKVIFTIDTPAE